MVDCLIEIGELTEKLAKKKKTAFRRYLFVLTYRFMDGIED